MKAHEEQINSIPCLLHTTPFVLICTYLRDFQYMSDMWRRGWPRLANNGRCALNMCHSFKCHYGLKPASKKLNVFILFILRLNSHLRSSPPINLPQSGSSRLLLRPRDEGGGVDARGISEHNTIFFSLLKVTLHE